ncbi:hypothetical protein VB796_23055 [Arcicella sp. LKC2W]|uniref:hypothetical protein n=1 Tax=Arcicella sp. LKC2W TaxID=2984198 RepID=UPI002B203E4A|nr:hypothetical protein [Arcicella sp. LKC2W]MEA5461968.1 hypothetical protein [Arcicella sp. LKC2W]
MKYLLLFFLLYSSELAFSQSIDKNLVFWSSTKKISIADFAIKTNNKKASSSFMQFSIDYNVNGFDFLTKNFNKKVRNSFIRTASWIDTTSNVEKSIRYQQTLFDISEIYTRKFRKQLKENRKKIARGTQIVEEINQSIMTEFSKRRIKYDLDTNFSEIEKSQKEWETQITIELRELENFATE